MNSLTEAAASSGILGRRAIHGIQRTLPEGRLQAQPQPLRRAFAMEPLAQIQQARSACLRPVAESPDSNLHMDW